MTGGGLVLDGVRVIDPYRGIDARTTVMVSGGRYVLEAPAEPWERFPGAEHLWLIPRPADLHVHLRDPGATHKEDLASGCRASTAGGFAVVGVMPNTVPVTDRADMVEDLGRRSEAIDLVDVWPIGAVTKGSLGEEPSDWDALRVAGARALSDDGRPVADPRILRDALTWSARTGVPVIQHLEDPLLSAGGVAHDGPPAHRLGLGGWPSVAESAMAFRDAAILHDRGGRLHFAHVSAIDTLEAVSWARRLGLALTAEVAPHHLLLTDDALLEWSGSPVTKVNPPLRPHAVREALRLAVAEGLVSVVASDHAPHAADEKRKTYEEAPFGISGVETLVAVLVTVFLQSGMMRPLDLFARVTVGPHRVVGEHCPGVSPGAPADFMLIDPDAGWVVDSAAFQSRGRNTPLDGRRLVGRVTATVRRGRVVYREGVVVDG